MNLGICEVYGSLAVILNCSQMPYKEPAHVADFLFFNRFLDFRCEEFFRP